jgi:hypothetical protein
LKFSRRILLSIHIYFFLSSAYLPSAYQQQQQQQQQQRASMMVGPSQSHDPYLSQQVPPNQTYPTQAPTNYLYKKSENPTTDSSNVDNQDSNKGNKLLINQLRSSSSNTSMLSTPTPISILTSSTTSTTSSTITPSSISTTNFPPNSVEATTIPSKIKRKKLTAKDVSMYHSKSHFSLLKKKPFFSSSSSRSMEINDVITWWFTC